MKTPRKASRSLRISQLETIPREPVESFVVHEKRIPFFPFIWHHHPEIELTLILDGRGLRFVGDSIEPYAEGDLCLLGGGLPHTWQSDARAGRVRSIYAQFPKAFPEGLRDAVPELRGLPALLDAARRGLVIGGRRRDALAEELVEVHRAPAGSWQRPLGLAKILAQLVALLPECRPLAAETYLGPAPDHADDDRLRAALELIESRSGQDLRQPEVAAAIGLSPSAFSRFFRRWVGKTFEDYANEVRVSRACQALVESEQPITEIAFEAGFNNLSNFNRRFRAVKGVTPREYRARHRDAERFEHGG